MGRVEMTEEGHKINVSVNVHHQEVAEEEESRVLEKVAEEGDVQKVEERLMKQLQSPPQACQERFSFDRSLRVLLAEDDDSTRHLVSAILQKCGYEVKPAENGPRAWKILEDLTSQIDLVLTEVTMPCLSGVELLSNIMSHGTFRSIPVVMMSSNDSMNTVLECLSKGAVDYLVKPIRKNELKNLWQHVWRRCLSSSNSGGRSGGTQKATKSRSFEGLGTETGSKNEDDIRSLGLNRDGSDDYSATQSSWTERAAELDSPGPSSPWDQPAYQTGSTSVQVMHPHSEMLGSKCTALSAADESKGQDDTHATAPATKDSDGRPPYLSCEEPSREAETHNGVIYSEKTFGENCTKEDEWLEEKHLGNNSEKLHGDSVELPIGFIAKSTDPQKIIKITDMLSGLSRLSSMENTVVVDAMYMPSVELTLRGPQDVKETNDSSHNRNMFQYSDLSAFSRYGSVSTSNEGTTWNVCSCSDATKAKSKQNHRSLSNNTQTNPGSYGSKNDNMCSTTNIAPKRTTEFSEKGKSMFMSFEPSSAFQPTLSCLQPIRLNTNALVAAGKLFPQPRAIDREAKELHHHHRYENYPFVYDKPLVKQQDNRDNTSLHCGSHDISGGVQVEGDTGNYHVSNGHMRCSVGVNPNRRNMEIDNKAGAKNGGTGEGVGQRPNHFSNRETALNRYRQKKNERCFKKKVRYQNRKKLAEQRPRIRGQFVRKGGETSKEKETQG